MISQLLSVREPAKYYLTESHFAKKASRKWRITLTEKNPLSSILRVPLTSNQGGRSCTGARVAPAEKFGLGRKFPCSAEELCISHL